MTFDRIGSQRTVRTCRGPSIRPVTTPQSFPPDSSTGPGIPVRDHTAEVEVVEAAADGGRVATSGQGSRPAAEEILHDTLADESRAGTSPQGSDEADPEGDGEDGSALEGTSAAD